MAKADEGKSNKSWQDTIFFFFLNERFWWMLGVVGSEERNMNDLVVERRKGERWVGSLLILKMSV